MATAPSYKSNVRTRPAVDPVVAPLTCDVCGRLGLHEDPVRLSGPAGGVTVCVRCLRLLLEMSPP